MSNIAIITDSASDMAQNNNKNITVLPRKFDTSKPSKTSNGLIFL